MRARTNQNAQKKQARRRWIFRRGGCDRVLICLAVNGPMTVRELGRAIGSDSHKTWDMVERLRLAGLVVKRNRRGGRKYVGLNRGLPIHRALKGLLLAVDQLWPAVRRTRKIARWYMPFSRTLTRAHVANIFQSPVRSRVLVFVAAVGETDMWTMYKILGLDAVSCMLAVNHWEKQGILRTRRFKRHRLVTLNPRFVVAKELKALLRQIVATSPEYRSLRTSARAKLRKLLKAARP